MQKTASANHDLATLVGDFVERLSAIVEAATTARVHAAVLSAAGVVAPRRRGRPPKNPGFLNYASVSAPVKRRPKQFCPYPGCKNVAAPVFGMVCSQHRSVPKAEIKKYREARRAKQSK